MKNSILISIFIFRVFTHYGQSVKLTFNAEDAVTKNSIAIHSIRIENLTRGSDTVISGPSPKLEITSFVGLNDQARIGPSLQVKQVASNPFSGSTVVAVLLPSGVNFHLALFDISGKQLTIYKNTLSGGIHKFEITSNNAGVLLLNANTVTENKSIKLINTSNSAGENSIKYLGSEKSLFKNSIATGNSGFLFSPGDLLQLTASIDGYTSSVLQGRPTGDETFTFQMHLSPLAVVSIVKMSNVSQTSASCFCNITAQGGSTVSARGVCWSTSPNPTISDSKTSSGAGLGYFNNILTGLTGKTLYYARAYAINSDGTSYSSEVSFTTLDPSVTVFSIIGTEPSWQDDTDFTYISTSGNILTYKIDSITFINNGEFKIRVNHSWDKSYGFANTIIKGDSTNFFDVGAPSGNIGVISKRKYEIILNFDKLDNSVTLFMNDITPFFLDISPKTILIKQGSTFNFKASYPSGSSNSIHYSIEPNIGTLKGSSYTSPANITNSQTVVLTAKSDLHPEIVSKTTIYLVGSSEYEGCNDYQLYQQNGIMIENNVWNAASISGDKQCTYYMNIENKNYFAWMWDYPSTATNVNAYPELIYGLKPFHGFSTTPEMPKLISSINTLKVDYEVEIGAIGGGYNLAFDNWITTKQNGKPEDIRFEFMIWEDADRLTPFGDLIATVNTTNGVYQLFKGEPTWEPSGTNWTYIAFVRIDGRTKGKVDIDEMLTYLVNNNIVPSGYYLSSLEIGNEVTSGIGFGVVKQFDITMH